MRARVRNHWIVFLDSTRTKITNDIVDLFYKNELAVNELLSHPGNKLPTLEVSVFGTFKHLFNNAI